MATVNSIALYYKDGHSDKEYHASIEESEGAAGYVVNFAYGRRGSALNTGTKTQRPVTSWAAEGVYDKLVREKMAKGYKPGADTKVFVRTEKAGKESIVRSMPQLLNEISEDVLKDLIWDDDYGLQEKKDGKRIMISVSAGTVEGSNRKGLVVALPKEVVDSLSKLPNCQLDGELVGTIYHVFDILDMDQDLTGSGYGNRYKMLAGLKRKFGDNVQLVPLYEGGVMKEQAFDRFKSENKEGVVFKRLDSEYTPGRPNSGGDQLKYKFYATCSAVVSKVNKQRSVGLMIEKTQVGNVTIPPNYKVPKIGNVVEVRYLYYNPGGALYQPTYLGVRDDMDASDCKMKQLKAKGVEDDN